MKRGTGLAVAFLAGLIVVGLAVAGLNQNWSTHAQGSGEVPANDSQGQAQAIFHLSDDGTELAFKLNVTNIEGVTQSHIHCGTPGVNGPVVVFLYGFNPAGVDPHGTINEGVITQANVIPRPASAACPGGVSTLADVIEKMNSGGAYVNVHTIALPPGEIRGDIK
jgi:hypothetical protein